MSSPHDAPPTGLFLAFELVAYALRRGLALGEGTTVPLGFRIIRGGEVCSGGAVIGNQTVARHVCHAKRELQGLRAELLVERATERHPLG